MVYYNTNTLNTMITVENLTFSYKRKKLPVLKDFSINLGRGKVCGLLGKNGAGKSTLLYLIAGLLNPQSGKVFFHGTDTRLRLPETLSDMYIVPDEFELPSIPLHRYISLYAPLYPNFSIENMSNYLKMFDMEDDVNLGELSLGQKKKVFISFALATNTSLLLMDEPTNGLDIPSKSQFRKIIASSMSDERCVIISTHQVRDIDRLLDHIIIMHDNSVLLNADTVDITGKLTFMETNDQELTDNALYSQFSLHGNSIILPNTNNADSEINLETLFNMSLEKPEIIHNMFNQNV